MMTCIPSSLSTQGAYNFPYTQLMFDWFFKENTENKVSRSSP
jgi:hypothetical protein